MSRIRLILLRIFVALGALVSLGLVRQHVRFATGQGLDEGLCSLVAVFDCSAIEASPFSEIAGTPTASFGLFYFVVFLIWLCSIRLKDAQRTEVRTIAAFASLIGLLASIALAAVSALLIGGFCLGCTTIYFITAACAVTAASKGPVQYFADAIAGVKTAVKAIRTPHLSGNETGPSRSMARSMILIILFIPVNFGAPVYMIQKAKNQPLDFEAIDPASNEAAKLLADHFKQPIVTMTKRENLLTEGYANAPLQITVFTDYTCPHCGRFNDQIGQILKTIPGKFHLTYKLLPLSSRCNPLIQNMKVDHENACPIAWLAQASGEMGKFHAIKDELYAIGSGDLEKETRRIAEDHGIDFDDWRRRSDDPAIREQIELDIREAMTLRISNLPSIWVNGRKLNSVDPAKVQLILLAVLEGA